VVRARAAVQYPAAFQLVAAMNPCPCGHAGQAAPRCQCRPAQLERYRARISGPLLDRLDLQLQLAAVPTAELVAKAPAGGLSTAEARARVCEARARQQARQGQLNAGLGPDQTLVHCRPDRAGLALLEQASRRRGYSARSQHRVLRVARTIADLAGVATVGTAEVAEALALRWPQ